MVFASVESARLKRLRHQLMEEESSTETKATYENVLAQTMSHSKDMPRREEHGQGDDNLPRLIDHGQSTITCIVPSEKVELLFSATTTD